MENVSTSSAPQSLGLKLERLAFIVLFITCALVPVLFFPSLVFPLQFGKILLLTLGTSISLILWIAARLKEGNLKVPYTPLSFAAGFVLLEFLVSSLFSSSINASLIGQGFEVGTFGFLLVMFMLFFLVSILFISKKRIFYSYIAFFTAFTLIALFHLSRLVFGPSFLSLGVFTDQTTNIIGKWNDLGIFISIASLLSLITLDLLSVKMLWRLVLWVFLVVSLGLLAIVNFNVVWIVLGVFALVFAFYLFSIGYKRMTLTSVDAEAKKTVLETPRKRLPYASLLTFVVCLVFVIWGTTFGEKISSKLQIFQIETRPSWSSTIDISKAALQENILLGVGPNRFVNVWLLNKPSVVNQTVFWNTDFSYGIGLLPTFVATTGLLGTLGWLAFLILFILLGVRSLFVSGQDAFSRYLATSSFLVALFLWVMLIAYIPTAVICALAFLFTGLFVATVYRDGSIISKSLSFRERPKLGFVVIVCLIIILIGSIAVSYVNVNKFTASLYLAKALRSFNQDGNIDATGANLTSAQNASESSAGYRFLAELALVKMNKLLSEKSDLSQDAIRTKFQGILGDALRNAEAAKNFDDKDYQNWVELGRVYEAVVPLGISGAYTNAAHAYSEAVKRNPHDPELYLIMARLEVANKDLKKAHEDVTLALKEKSNYTEAVFFLSQLQVQEGDIKSALASANAAALLAPTDPVVQFQLGLLQYNNRNFKEAVSALTQAVTLNPVYANAKYFLGLSLYQVGKPQEALAQFESIKQTNTDNKEVDLIIANLKAGRSPFVNAKPPIDSTPEKRSTLPLKEPTTGVQKP